MLNPETITVLDPACGSGHILVEAYDVLKAIYLERGYQLRNIPRLILEKNLYGLDIDDRAAQLAGFALLMKARADDRRLFDELPKLNVYSLQSSKNLNLPLLWQQLDLNGQSTTGVTSSLFDEPQASLIQDIDDSSYQLIKTTLVLFEQAQTLGSLIQVPAEHAAPLKDLLAQLQALTTGGNSFQKIAATTLIPFIRQAVILGMQFDAVVANPPYMGGKGMNQGLKEFAKCEFPDSKSDLFAMFVERCSGFGKSGANFGFVTPYTWMFLSSYEKLRSYLFTNQTIYTLVKPSYTCFFESAIIPLVTFTTQKSVENIRGTYIDLGYLGSAESQPIKLLEAIETPNSTLKHFACKNDFNKIPGNPIAYWASKASRNAFEKHPSLSSVSKIACGMTTGDNETFTRRWNEVDFGKIGIGIQNRFAAKKSGKKWFPYNKGGDFRKWYGNNDFVVNWENDGNAILTTGRAYPRAKDLYFQESATWSFISSSYFGVRYSDHGFIFDMAGCSAFAKDNNVRFITGLLCSTTSYHFLKFTNPTLNFQVGNVSQIPLPNCNTEKISTVANCAIEISKKDWNNYEASWNFYVNPLISNKQITQGSTNHQSQAQSVGWVSDRVTQHTEATDVGLRDKAANPTYKSTNLEQCFKQWQSQNRAAIVEMQRLEEENNRLFIDAYGLQDELSPEVPEEQITLNRADREKDCQRLISYAIGCMMGRYSLDKPGLIYARAGNVDFDKIYYGTDSPPFEKGGPGGILHITQAASVEQNQEQIPPNPPFSKGGIFLPDADGIVPITDELWFEDDAANRINEFLLVVWDAETLEENRAWLAESLGQKGNETPQETIRRYIAGSFYKNHLQTYKKRPIYWLFSSGKQGAFQALVYLHRYNESTLARMRAEYVVPLTGKIQSRIEMLKKDAAVASSNTEKSKLDKDIDKLGKKYVELLSFDEKLRYYADLRIQLDLDDGVKVNYGKFGDLLAEVKAVTGGKDE